MVPQFTTQREMEVHTKTESERQEVDVESDPHVSRSNGIRVLHGPECTRLCIPRGHRSS